MSREAKLVFTLMFLNIMGFSVTLFWLDSYDSKEIKLDRSYEQLCKKLCRNNLNAAVYKSNRRLKECICQKNTEWVDLEPIPTERNSK